MTKRAKLPGGPKEGQNMKKSVVVALILSFVAYLATTGILEIQFDRGCEGYLKRAADSNTVELAKENLEVAVKYAEGNNMTNGYTSVVYRTPNEDVGFWYKNLSASLVSLREVGPETGQLERSNILMKLRETLLDHTSSGDKVTVPEGISRFPNNRLLVVWAIASFVLSIVGLAKWKNGDLDY